ncbi:MAG: SDR family NAD(P)-dependent oxidoreductase [Gammaproteobacteria bacterium]
MAGKENKNSMVPLAIVGIGCLFPKASNPEEYWANIREGVDAIGDVPDTHWKVSDYFDDDQTRPDMTYARRGGFIDPVDFNPLLYGMSPNNIEATDTTQLLGMVVARDALLDAGYSTAKDAGDGREFNRDRTSVIMGVTGTLELVIPLGARLGHPIWRKALQDAGVDPETTEDVVQRIADGYVPWQENSFPGLLGNVAAGRIANRFDLGGTNCVVDAACASSLSAIHLAALELSAGRVDMAITGGMDTFNDIFMYMCFSKTPALSPTGNSRPFAKDGDGTILGEGLGAVIMKRLDDAQRDGDRIYAVLKGMGSSSDGRGNAIYAPSADGQTKALWNAYREADVSPRSIELVETHGTGTAVGDAVEARALSGVYSSDNEGETWCAIGSVKSMIGHTKAAAGVAGLIKTALSLKHKVLPPSIKVDEPLEILNPGTAPIYLNTIKRPWIKKMETPRRAALSSFGFGGSNFHCVMEEAVADKTEVDWDGHVLLLALSADSSEALLKQLPGKQVIDSWNALRFYCYDSCQTFKPEAKQRLLLVIEKDKTDVNKLLADATARINEDANTAWQTGHAFYGTGTQTDKTAFLFPGQGSQYVGMLRDLACQFPECFHLLQRADEDFADANAGQSLTDVIYPIPVFSTEDRKRQEETLRQTQHAQPAIGAVSAGCFHVLGHFDVKPDIAIGHSYGELTALHVAGFYDETAFHTLSRLRGKLMGQGEGDRGAMLAVVADIDRVRTLLDKHNIKLVIANHNSPEQVVLSGASEQVEAFNEIAATEKLRTVRLPVAAAFHSEFVADAAKPFARAVGEIQFHKNTMPVLSNTTTEAYPGGIDSQKKLLSAQLANPVRFVEQVEKLYAEGVRTFIEVGPGKTLTGLVDAILKDRPGLTLAVDASRGKKQGQLDLACVLAALASSGKKIGLDKWDAACAELERPDPNARPALTVSINGANIMQTRPQRPPRQPRMETDNNMNTTQTKTQQAATDIGKQDADGTPITNPNLLQATQQSILALQKMQEQTARLHQQYLEGQETAQKTIHSLLQQQQALLSGGSLPATSVPEVSRAPVTTASEPAPAPKTEEPAVESPAVIKEIKETRERLEQHQDFDIDNLLLKVVSEKTGYPLEMLSLEMSLDTDLGIDSIKRVEILSALQEQLPWSPVIKPEELGTFQFLQHIVEFIAAGKPDDIGTTSAPVDDAKTGNTAGEFDNTLLEIVAEKTGYPLEMLELDMHLDSDLGIDSIKRVEILSALQEAIPGLPTVAADELAQLQTLRSITEFFAGQPMPAAEPAGQTEAVSSMPTGFDNTLLEVVADKTGYPVDMLSLDMQLDSDLGIDSIKRVEILSALQERMPELPTVSADELASIQTLGSIIDMFSATDAEAATVPAVTTDSTGGDLPTILLEVVADKTGYPAEMLNLDMQLDGDLGIDSIKRVEILSALQERMPDLPVVSADNLATLQTLQQIIDYMQTEIVAEPVKTQTPVTTADSDVKQGVEIPPATEAPLQRNIIRLKPVAFQDRPQLVLDKTKPILVTEDGSELCSNIVECLQQQGYQASVISLDDIPTGPLGGLIICALANPDKQFLLKAFELLQHCAPSIKDSKGLLASVTTLGGGFGFDSSLRGHAMQAGLFGMVKTADKEWSQVNCKCVDIDAKEYADAEALVEELLFGGPLEAGLRQGKTLQPVLEQQRLPAVAEPALLSNEDLVVISGGARGVTAEVAVELAQTYRCKLLLLGRSPEPEQEPEWLQEVSDEATIKQRLLAHAETKLKPAELESQYKAVLANREILNTLNRIEAADALVRYASVDISDADAVSNVIDLARIDLGNVTGIIHAAGVLADRLIEDKTQEQFKQVFNTKVDGLENLLSATANDDLKLIVLFSSTTARLGRKGQVDYAVANEVLNKMAQREQLQRDNCKVVSANWGPWDGGMVTPALKKLFADEGVGVIGLRAGAEYLVNEIESNGPVETVVLGEYQQAGDTPLLPRKESEFTLAFERELSVSSYSFLQSHVMNGQAVLPVAVIIEWFAHGALHLNPGMQFHGFDDFRVTKGVTLNADEKIQLRILAGKMMQQGDVALIPVELRSEKFIHATATIVLSDTVNKSILPKLDPVQQEYQAEQGAYYQNGQLFHGHHLQGIRQVTHCSEQGIVADVNAAPSPANWMSQPIRSSWLTDPLVLDSAFQMMILWSFEQQGIGSLPTAIARYRQYQRSFPSSGVKVVARVEEHTAMQARAAIEFLDENGKLIALIDGYECIRDGSLQKAFKANDLSLQD